jgi:hypothetical protein
MDKASLRTATLGYQDASLLSKLIPALAAQQNMTPGDLVALATTTLDVFRIDQGTQTQAVIDALTSFVADYQQPKGPLRLTFNPPAAATVASVGKSSVPDSILAALGLSVSYAGTVSRPVAARAPTGVQPPPPATPSCTPGVRLFVLNDGAWWAATVREATASKKDCVVKLDGGGPADNAIVGAGSTVSWSIDGPGKPATACRKDDVVLVESDGGWYPARIKATRGPKLACPVHYDDTEDDEDEDVPLDRVRVLK